MPVKTTINYIYNALLSSFVLVKISGENKESITKYGYNITTFLAHILKQLFS